MSSQKALIIESDHAFASSIESMLEPYGFQSDIINDGAAGLQRAKDQPPDLIVLCVELPKMSGYAVCNKLKKSKGLKKVPLIIMSAEATPETFEQHKKLKTRADAYVLKNEEFTQEVFIGAVGKLVTLETAQQEESPITEQDPDLDNETDAAFSELEVDNEENPIEEISSEETEIHDFEMGDIDEDVLEMDEEPIEEEIIEEEVSIDDDMMDLGLDEVLEEVGSEEDQAPDETYAKEETGVPNQIADELKALREERDALEKKLEEALSGKEAVAEKTFDREREFLNLRETINKKERQLLELNETLDAKEREILDKKEALRKHERTKQELDAKILDLDREKFEVLEKAEGLNKELQTTKDLLAKTISEKEELEKELNLTRNSAQEAEEVHRNDLASLKSAHQQELENTRNVHRAEIDSLKSQHEESLNELNSAHQKELENTKNELNSAHQEELENTKNELNSAHQQELENTRNVHRAEIDSLKSQHEESLNELKSAHQEELENTKNKLNSAHAEETTSLKERFENRIQEIETDFSGRQEEQKTLYENRIADLENNIENLDRVLKQTTKEKETLSEHYDSLTMKFEEAEQRMSGNAAVVDRTKQALAVALTLLDEQFAYAEEESDQE